MNEQPPRAARRRLIDELQALSESLQGDGTVAITPEPLSPSSLQPLLDLGAIFDDSGLPIDDDGEAPLLFWPLQELTGFTTAPLALAKDRDALIEQIVARLLPDLERQLRDQLRGLDVEHLQRLLR